MIVAARTLISASAFWEGRAAIMSMYTFSALVRGEAKSPALRGKLIQFVATKSVTSKDIISYTIPHPPPVEVLDSPNLVRLAP